MQKKFEKAHYEPAELQGLLLKLIEERGACSTSELARELNAEPNDIRKALSWLCWKEQLVWIGPLPRSGVYFTLTENRGRSAFPLRNSIGGYRGSRGVGKRTMQVRQEIMDYLDLMRVSKTDASSLEVAEIVEMSLHATVRHLRALESQGKIRMSVSREHGRGRPPYVWVALAEEDRGIVVYNDQPNILTVNFFGQKSPKEISFTDSAFRP